LPEVGHPIQLSWGPGPGSRMLAPGLPDLLFSDGSHLGWVTTAGVYALLEDIVHLIPAPLIQGIATAPGTWVVVHGVPGHLTLTRFDPRNPSPQHLEFPLRHVQAGASWAVLDHGYERSVIDLVTQQSVHIPAGASDARPQAWADGPGLVWLQQGTVYRAGKDLQVRVSGTLPGTPISWQTGPKGAAVFLCQDHLWGMHCVGPPIRLPPMDASSIRFSPCGTRVLGSTSDGVMEVCLRSGDPLWAAQGRVSPVGFGPEAIVLEEASGRVRDAEGSILAEGFNPSAAALEGDRLYGPGGTAWDLTEGTRCWTHAPLEAVHLVALESSVVAISDHMEIFDLHGERRSHCVVPLDTETEGEPIDVRRCGDELLEVELEEACFYLTLDGRRTPAVGPSAPPSPAVGPVSCSAPGERPAVALEPGDWGPARSWPLDADDAVMIAARVWCWNEDGMLCALDPGGPATSATIEVVGDGHPDSGGSTSP